MQISFPFLIRAKFLNSLVLRPKLKSKKVENMYFTGQLTVPGPGVPPALISGKLVAELIEKNL